MPKTRAKTWTIRNCVVSVSALKCQKAARTSIAISRELGAFAIAHSRARHHPRVAVTDPARPVAMAAAAPGVAAARDVAAVAVARDHAHGAVVVAVAVAMM